MVDAALFTQEASALLPTLHRLAVSILRAEADAQDAVQQALLKAWAAREGARPQSFRAWLTRITVNECRNVQRYRMRVYPAELVETGFADQPEDWELEDALAGLPEKLRTPLLLRYMEQYSEKEIAEALHVPVTTVKNRLFRARRGLAEALQEGEVVFE